MFTEIKKKFTEIADAIRKVKNTNQIIRAKNFANEIKQMAFIDRGTVTGPIDRIEIQSPNISLDEENGKIISSVSYEKGYTDNGTQTNEYQMETQQTQTIIPSINNQIISKGKFLTGDQTIQGDSNLKSENILRGKNGNRISMFGIYGTLDTVRKFNNYVEGNGYYGNQVADCARSYHLAKINGEAQFRYSQSKGLFGDGTLTDENGKCWMDCSTFGGLNLRGIPFHKTPYYLVKGQPNKTLADLGLDSTIVSQLCEESEYEYANKYLDRQDDSSLNHSFKEGYKSIRTAAEYAEYFYGQGYTLYEFSTSPTSVPSGLLPGDLLFWSKEAANNNQKSRFKAISHMGIVGRNTSKYYQATGYADERETETIFYQDISSSLSELSYIARPNYNPIKIDVTPLGVNLLPRYYFDSLQIDASKTSNGVTFTPKVEGGFKVQRTASSSSGTTFYLYSSSNPVKLEPGTYELSGTPIHATASSTGTALVWGLSVKDADTKTGLTDINGATVWDRGSGSTFQLTETINAYVYFFVAASLSDTSVYEVIPKLIRTE